MFPIYNGPNIMTLIWMLGILIHMVGILGVLVGLVYWSLNSKLKAMSNKPMISEEIEQYLENLNRYLMLKGFSAKKSKHKLSESETLSKDDLI